MSRHPNVKWAQRSDMVYITIDLPDAQDVKLKLEPEGKFLFSATTGPEKTPYEVDLDLYDKIDINETKTSVGLRNICYLVKKAEDKWWSRLIKQQGRAPIFLKVDWDKWVDEDEEPEEVKGDEGGPGGFGNNMDFGGLGNNMDFGGLGNNMNFGGLGNNMNFGDFDLSKLNMGGDGLNADALGKFDAENDESDAEDETVDQQPSAAGQSDAKPLASAEHDAKASA
ncbi:co-chaperone protein p23-1-like isoform X1 [Malus sylvestris]|uniref:co-chaperone protein p23-1-like isoform X1 n=1 Tax=Malus sylvestris TaxID=3752 RepID=UPI0021AD2201|nr:co-chaperone protein p23-1-like isoform X1 [Malus sylvestris]